MARIAGAAFLSHSATCGDTLSDAASTSWSILSFFSSSAFVKGDFLRWRSPSFSGVTSGAVSSFFEGESLPKRPIARC